MPRRLILFAGLILMVQAAFASAAQPGRPGYLSYYGYLWVDNRLIAWPSPESIAHDLESTNDQVRLHALQALGLEEQELYVQQWSQETPSRPTGQQLIWPDLVSLTYAALGENGTKQAVLAIQSDQAALVFAAVATPGKDGWHRIAAIGCGCRYDPNLAEFLSLAPWPESPIVPSHFELVLRASNGGTGLYVQEETRFRVHGRRLQPLLSFERRRRDCNSIGFEQCLVTQRTFIEQLVSVLPGELTVCGALTTQHARIRAGEMNTPLWPAVAWQMPAGAAQCQAYRWNNQTFRYKQEGSNTDLDLCGGARPTAQSESNAR